MSSEEDFFGRFLGRAFPPFRKFDRFFEEFEESFKTLADSVPHELYRERQLPDGSTIREIGPVVYGYSITIGPDGKPVVREFGNASPSLGRGRFAPKLEVKNHREPLIDTIDEGDKIRIVAELPGAEKEEVNLSTAEKSVTISVDTPKIKYHKEVPLPSDVDPDSAKASYKNGILDLTLRKARKLARGKEIKVE